MSYAAIAELVTANRLTVFTLLEEATDKVIASPHVTHVYVRGSLVHGTADRLSDLDFVAGVADEHFCDFRHVLDALMTTEFNAILPGWRDSIVIPMGGLGYVYLVVNAGKLQQLDFYLVPTSRAADIPNYTSAQLVYRRDQCPAPEPGVQLQIEQLISAERSRKLRCVELIVEVLVLTQMIRKRLRRGQRFLAYGETHMVRTAVKDLVKAALAPDSVYRGWYRLEEELGISPIGRACLRDLLGLVTTQPPSTESELDGTLDRCLHIAALAAPAAMGELAEAVDAYRNYLEIA